MRVHLDILGWLHVIWGVFGLLTGLSLEILAIGTQASIATTEAARARPTVWLLAAAGGVLVSIGAIMIVAGRGLIVRHRLGRIAALSLAVPNLLIVPFGTALALYTLWTLFTDEARRAFTPPDTIRR